jgi:hypothetical protein
MGYDKEVDDIEAEWSREDGFFWCLRQGQFSEDKFNRTMEKLSNLSVADDDADIPRRLVSLLWYIPLFMQWQVDRVRETGGDVTAYMRAITLATNEIERLLGVP